MLRRRRQFAAVLVFAVVAGLVELFGPSPRAERTVAVDGSAVDSTAAESAGAAGSATPTQRLSPEMMAIASQVAIDPMQQGNGTFAVVPGSSKQVGEGTAKRFLVEVEHGLDINRRKFAKTVEQALFDRRSWARNGTPLMRVDEEPVDFRVTLAGTDTVDWMCSPLQTNGSYSCWNGTRAMINFRRWMAGADAYGDDLVNYRRYAVNHEVGHALGHGHQHCPAADAPAPIMVQQTIGVGACQPNPWPFVSP